MEAFTDFPDIFINQRNIWMCKDFDASKYENDITQFQIIKSEWWVVNGAWLGFQMDNKSAYEVLASNKHITVDVVDKYIKPHLAWILNKNIHVIYKLRMDILEYLIKNNYLKCKPIYMDYLLGNKHLTWKFVRDNQHAITMGSKSSVKKPAGQMTVGEIMGQVTFW